MGHHTGCMAAQRSTDRVLVARIAALERWAHEPDRRLATEPARRGLLAKFEAQVDPRGILMPDERARRAHSAMVAHMLRLSLKSAKARRVA